MPSAEKVTIKALVRSSETEQALRAALAAQARIRLEVVQGSLPQRLDAMTRANAADVVIVDLDLGDPSQIEALQEIIHNGAQPAPVIATSAQASVDDVRRLMRMRVVDYLPQPLIEDDVRSVVEAAVKRRQAAEGPPGTRTHVLAFTRASGGVGATALAIQTAFELAKRTATEDKPRVCLVDLDLQFGNAALYLDLEPNLKLLDIVGAPHRLDKALLESMAARHEGGVDLYAVPNMAVSWEEVPGEIIARILEVACESYEYVVIDTPRLWMGWMADVLGGSDAVFLVTLLSVPGIRQARQFLQTIHRSGVPDGAVSVVLNRYVKPGWGGGAGLRVKEAERALARKIDYYVSEDAELVSEALNQGVPIAEVRRRSRIEKQVRAMIDAVLSALEREKTVARRAAAQ